MHIYLFYNYPVVQEGHVALNFFSRCLGFGGASAHHGDHGFALDGAGNKVVYFLIGFSGIIR